MYFADQYVHALGLEPMTVALIITSYTYYILVYLSLMFLLMRLARSPPSQYSITIYNVAFVRSIIRS